MGTTDITVSLNDTGADHMRELAAYHGVSLPVIATAVVSWYSSNRLHWSTPEELTEINPAVKAAEDRLSPKAPAGQTVLA